MHTLGNQIITNFITQSFLVAYVCNSNVKTSDISLKQTLQSITVLLAISMTVLSPFVYWAQNEQNLFIKVDLKDVKDTNISLEDRKICFQATGLGARGTHKYGFSLDFNADVNPEASNYKVLDNKVDFTIQKVQKAWWNRLTSQPQKPVWLKIDFDKWQSEEDLNDDEEVRDIREDYPDLYKNLQKEEQGFTKEDWKKVYLAFYNLGMYIGFLYVLIVLGMQLLKNERDMFEDVYASVGPAMIVLQLLQFLEILHPLFGYTKSSVMSATMQVVGRAVVLLGLIDSEPRLQTKPVIFYLFLVWTAIEVIRYPYYITQIYNKENSFLTWLRYTIWIPLYPMGFISEGVIILRSIPYFEETGKYTWALPNKFNFIFSFPMLLRVYLLCFMLPSMYVLMHHMYKLRQKKLGPKKWQKSKKK